MYRFRFEEVIETTVSYSPRKKLKSHCLNCSRKKAEETLKSTMSEQTICNTQVNNSQPRKIGSVADIDPTSGVYGSMGYNSYAHQSHSQPQQQLSHHHQLHYAQQQQQQPQMSISSQMQQQPSTSQSQQEQSQNQQFHFPQQSTSFESSPSKIADVLKDKFHEVSDVMMKGSPQDRKNLASVLVCAMTKNKDLSAAKTSTIRRQILFESSDGSSLSSQEMFGVFQRLKPNDFQSFKVTVLPLLSASSRTLAENIIGNLEYMVEAFNHGGTIQKEEDLNSAICHLQKNFEYYRTNRSFPGVRDLMIGHLLGNGIIKIKDKSRFTKVMNYMSGLTTTEQ
ncbi:phospholipase D A-like isoform X2 [Sitodiplosis mosellana]|uniref:phospholipase D A-like isoform X2 n=1 Tax=Sitodiplosis mosellana TaxID=263140 RepID=UPI0024440D04|nr:phospholipase D A-like isoform X2 [Sitodiplosis mosellana]